jgi:hypothetical protein
MPEPSTQTNVPSAASQPPKRRSKLVIILLTLAGILAVFFIAIQLITVNRSNPPVTTQLNWDSPQTKTLAYRACMDCHSNETTWPWYAYVAPSSWLIYYDVERGRSELNLSTYDPAAVETRVNPFGQRPGDLAYQLGQILSEGGQQREPRGAGGPPPGGQFPRPAPGQGQGQFPAFSLSDRLTENIQNNRMPPDKYLLLHPTAKLTTAERQQLLQGLSQTLGLAAN